MATIQIQRASEYNNRLRDFKVFIDGQNLGAIGNEETKTFPVSPGNHTLCLKIDWCSSPEISFDIAEEQTCYFKTGGNNRLRWIAPVAGGILLLHFILRKTTAFQYTAVLAFLPFLALAYYLTLGRKDYLLLERDSFWEK